MTTSQIAVRLPATLLAAVDELVAAGRFESRAAVVRYALEEALDADRRSRIGEAIVAGYQRQPQDDDDLAAWAEGAGVDMVREEPW